VYEKGATTRAVYLPAGKWYDWWTLATHEGGQTIARPVDLATMPLFVRGGAIIPVDPIRQYTSQSVDEPTTLRIFPGADGRFIFYDDDGTSLAYIQGEQTIIELSWDDTAQTLTLVPQRNITPREFLVCLVTAETKHRVTVRDQPLTISLAPAR
jgi:alpha-glucosidase/alpha-D-xyloside xylohydrolase